MTDVFDNATSITIGNKEVKSIEIDGGTIWESNPPEITLTCKKSDSGTITLLSNVSIKLNNVTKSTDSEGVVVFENVPDGTYEIQCDTGGSVRTTNITISNENPIMDVIFDW